MSLRMRLFLLLAAVVAGLVVAQWWFVQRLSRDLKTEVGQVALSVGESMVTSLANDHAPMARAGSAEIQGAPARPIVTERVIHVKDVGGRLEIVGERVTIGPKGATGPAFATPGPTDATLMLRMESPLDARFIQLTGPGGSQSIPMSRRRIAAIMNSVN